MKETSSSLYRIIKPIGKLGYNLFSGYKIYGKEKIPKEGAMIIAGNHIGISDPLLVCASTKRIVHFLAKVELFKKPFLGFLLNRVAVIPVDRSRENPEVIDLSVKYLNDGKLIGIFPEGTRNKERTEKLLPFKYGAVSLASKTNTKILPFAVKGYFKIFRRELRILYGNPIDISGMNLDEANEYLRKTISDLIDKLEELK